MQPFDYYFSDPEIPVTGVMNATQAVFDSCFYDDSAIDLTFEAFAEEYRREHDLDPDDDIPDDVLDCLEIDEPEYLLGDWKLGDDGKYDVAPGFNQCGYAAVTGYLGGACIVHVVWSETTRKVLAMCSPCCPGQADLDSGEGEILAYALPAEFNWDGE